MADDGLFDHLRIEATGDVSLDEAWDRYRNPERWAEWAPQIRGVRGISSPLTAHQRGWVLGPWGFRVPVRILHVDAPGRAWRWRVGVPPAAVEMDHGLDEVSDGTRAWVLIRLPRAVAWPYLPVARHALGRLVRA